MANGDQELTNVSQTGWRPLVLDVDAYRPHLTEYALTQTQEDQLLQALWSVMVAVVDVRFRLHRAASRKDSTNDIPLDRILAGMLASPEENPNNSNEITVRGADRPSAEKEDS